MRYTLEILLSLFVLLYPYNLSLMNTYFFYYMLCILSNTFPCHIPCSCVYLKFSSADPPLFAGVIISYISHIRVNISLERIIKLSDFDLLSQNILSLQNLIHFKSYIWYMLFTDFNKVRYHVSFLMYPVFNMLMIHRRSLIITC